MIIIARVNSPGSIAWPAGTQIITVAPKKFVVVSRNGRAVSFWLIGPYAGQPVFATTTGWKGLYNFLDNDPAVSQVATIKQARNNAPFWAWLTANVKRVVKRTSDGAVVGIVADHQIYGLGPPSEHDPDAVAPGDDVYEEDVP